MSLYPFCCHFWRFHFWCWRSWVEAVGLEVLDLCFALVVGRCGPEWWLHFWCWWGWVAGLGLEVLDLCFLLVVGVAALLGMESFGSVKFWDDGFEKPIKEPPNSYLGMPFLPLCQMGFEVRFFRPHHVKICFSTVTARGVTPKYIV